MSLSVGREGREQRKDILEGTVISLSKMIKCITHRAGEKKSLFLSFSTVLNFLCPTVWIHKGPIS